jgi:inner membrane protease ATP23
MAESRAAEPVPKQDASASPQAQPDAAFDRWRRKAAWVAGYGLSPEDEAKRAETERLERLDREWSKCQKWKTDLMKNSPSVSFFPRTKFKFKFKFSSRRAGPAVVFMIQQLALVTGSSSSGGSGGGVLTPAHVVCAPCHQKLAGGFSPQHGILRCQDGFMNKRHMEDTLVHELVHMYDHAKFRVDWHNIRHHACSEVRPSPRVPGAPPRALATDD